MWADQISHYMEHDQHDYTMKGEMVQSIERAWGVTHEIDRFADERNCVVTTSGRFNSRFANSSAGAEWVDAFTVDWRGPYNWVHPPYLLIDRVLDHAQRCKARGTLVVPDWPTRPFWPKLFRERSPVGGVHTAAEIGIPDRLIQTMGRWRSQNMVGHYIGAKRSARELAERLSALWPRAKTDTEEQAGARRSGGTEGV